MDQTQPVGLANMVAGGRLLMPAQWPAKLTPQAIGGMGMAGYQSPMQSPLVESVQAGESSVKRGIAYIYVHVTDLYFA